VYAQSPSKVAYWTKYFSCFLVCDGTLVLKGSVKTEAQKREAAKLAKDVPNVQQVVDELEVKPGKHSTPNS
jgi:iron uptake system EfeUOB component EfeO/EfeM